MILVIQTKKLINIMTVKRIILIKNLSDLKLMKLRIEMITFQARRKMQNKGICSKILGVLILMKFSKVPKIKVTRETGWKVLIKNNILEIVGIYLIPLSVL